MPPQLSPVQTLDHNVSLATPPGFLEAAIVTAIIVALGVVGYFVWRRMEAKRS